MPLAVVLAPAYIQMLIKEAHNYPIATTKNFKLEVATAARKLFSNYTLIG